MAHRGRKAAPDNHGSVISQRHAVQSASRDCDNVGRTGWHVGLAVTIAAPGNDASVFEQCEQMPAAGADSFHVGKTGGNIGLTAAIHAPYSKAKSLADRH